jgi:hypothetical protein
MPLEKLPQNIEELKKILLKLEAKLTKMPPSRVQGTLSPRSKLESLISRISQTILTLQNSRLKIPLSLQREKIQSLLSEVQIQLGQDSEMDEKIQKNYKLFLDYVQNAKDTGYDISSFFGGNNLMGQKPQINHRHLPIDTTVPKPNSFAQSINTGANYTECYARPLDRYKFYHSFRLDVSPEIIQKYLQEIFEKCKEKGISLQIKTEDHIYDVCNFYTWHFEELKIILQEFYPKYAKPPYNLFATCERVFQGNISGISPHNIAFAQEPVTILSSNIVKLGRQKTEQELNFEKMKEKYGIDSHSGRMINLGKNIASKTPEPTKENFSQEDFIKSCQEVGIRPDAPYLVANL